MISRFFRSQQEARASPTLTAAPPPVTSLPLLSPVGETEVKEFKDDLSDHADGGGSERGSERSGSAVNSAVGSASNSMVSSLPGSKLSLPASSKTGANFSAFTAPPRYRNSGAFVHGTKFRNFDPIMQQGLKAGKADIFMIDEVRADGRVPGLQNRPEILIFIDEAKARCENMEFDYDPSTGIWKTKGINGVIRPWFFQKVVDQRPKSRGNVLFQSKQDPMMQANVIRGPHKPKQLIHATYWENIYGIMREGIVPVKNPVSSFRQPFKDLLQGAENVVYTVNASKSAGSRENSKTRQKDAQPEVVPEDPHEENLDFPVGKDCCGMERTPDAYIIIDTDKAEALNLTLVQSADREETVLVKGKVPLEAIAKVEVNEPVELSESLKAQIVDPKSFEEIPVIDVSNPNEAELVEQMRFACEVAGFMQVKGHGVPEELIERHMELQKRFFALPEDTKARLTLSDDSPVRGYFGKGGEDLDQVLGDEVDKAEGKKIAKQSRKDNKEALDTNAVPWAKPVGGYVAEVFAKPSRLPAEEELSGFREVLNEYDDHMFRLSKRLLSVMALVLGKDKDFFEPYLTNPVATHRLLHYWPLKNLDAEIGVGEHTDYGLLTILKQDAVGGLQVLNAKDRRWVHCCPIDGAFVVNLGDMLARWTAHRFKSTIHRVVNLSPIERYSVPYFLEPNLDTVIVPGGICDGPAGNLDELSEHERRCLLRKWWKQVRDTGSPATAEDILGRFYRASGQLKK